MFLCSHPRQLTSQHWPGARVIQVELIPFEVICQTMHRVYEFRGEKRKKSNLRKSEKDLGDQ